MLPLGWKARNIAIQQHKSIRLAWWRRWGTGRWTRRCRGKGVEGAAIGAEVGTYCSDPHLARRIEGGQMIE